MSKVYVTKKSAEGSYQCWFWCPGCGHSHAFTMPHWTWNGDENKPSFQPSLMCNKGRRSLQCHSVVTDGVINFCSDSHHHLAGKSVAMEDWKGFGRG